MKLYAILFASLLFFSCSTSNNMMKPNNSANISGTEWKGTTPCADCEGISVRLSLNPDKTFRESNVYLGKNVTPFVDSGKWALDGKGLITLTSSNGQKSYLQVAGPQLQMLDANKKAIKNDLKDMFYLKKAEGEENEAIFNEKMMSGTDFTASGNEPFWGLDIDFETNISFATADGFELNVPFKKTEGPAPENTITYASMTDNGSIDVAIKMEKCVNSMSGAASNYTVKVNVTNSKGVSKTYTGCGRYLGNARLNNMWKLKSIGEQPNDTVVIKEAPDIQFRIEDEMVFGFSGCNRFHGSMEIINDSISFKQMATTLMACPEPAMQLEDRFLKLISGQKLNFILTDNLLYLGEGINRMVFESEE